jgi:hypothetical protein
VISALPAASMTNARPSARRMITKGLGSGGCERRRAFGTRVSRAPREGRSGETEMVQENEQITLASAKGHGAAERGRRRRGTHRRVLVGRLEGDDVHARRSTHARGRCLPRAHGSGAPRLCHQRVFRARNSRC